MKSEPMLTPREKSPQPRLRGGLNPHSCIKKDSKPTTLMTELFQPPNHWYDLIRKSREGSLYLPLLKRDHPIGLVVKAPTLGVEDLGSDSRHGDFSGSSHTSDLKIGTPVAILPGGW